MLLSQSAKYALRAAIHLAASDDEALLSRQIAESLQVPAQYLAKILQDLVRHGILTSTRGRGGGFRLARPAPQIPLLHVVKAIDGENFGEECALGLPHCSDVSPCALHDSWAHLRGDIIAMLSDTSLADLGKDGAVDR